MLTGLTGLAYFRTKYLVQSSDPFSVLNHPLEPWFLKAHILVSPLLLLAVGSVAVRHVWKHYRLGVVLGRRSGVTMVLAFLPMVTTGYLIQAITHPGRLSAVTIAHLILSGLYLAGLVVHQAVTNRRRPGVPDRRSRGGRRRTPGERSDGNFSRPGAGQSGGAWPVSWSGAVTGRFRPSS